MSTPTGIPDELMENAGEDAQARSSSKARLNRKALIALVAIVGCVAVSFGAFGLYLLVSAVLEPVSYGFSETRRWILTAAGLASLPIAALMAALLFALALKRAWLRRWNLWAAAALAVLAIAGGLSFHHPYDGALSWFTPTYSGLSPLGGNVGYAVIGGYEPGVLGGLRAAALGAVAFALALPSLLGGFGRAIGQGLGFIYLGAFMALRAVTSKSPPKEELPDFSHMPNAAHDPQRDRLGGDFDLGGHAAQDGGAFAPSTSLGQTSSLWNGSPGAPSSGLGERLSAYGGGLSSSAPSDIGGATPGAGAAPFSTSILGGGLSGGAFASALAATADEPDGGDKPKTALDAVEAVDEGESEGADDAESAAASQDFSRLIAVADEPAVSDADNPTFAENGFVSAANGHANGANGVSPSVYDHAVSNGADDGDDLAAYGLEPDAPPALELDEAAEDVDEEDDALALDDDLAAPMPAANGAGELAPKTNDLWADEFADGDNDDVFDDSAALLGGAGAAAAVGGLAAASTRGATAYGDDDDEDDEDEGATFMWARPTIDLLKEGEDNRVSEDELNKTAETITRTLGEYGVEVEVGHVRTGPTVTMYGLVPGYIRRSRVVKEVDEDGRPVLDEAGKQISKRVEQKTRVKVDSILAREKDLALALKTPSLRLETPAMGKSLVGIEVPNPNPSLVTLRSVMESGEYQTVKKRAHLPIALGRGSGGESVSFDLAKMPHLLVAGATGSGKSVCLNAIVSCMIMEKTPVELRLLLIDPKRVELTPYNGVPHLLAPVVVETDSVVGYLKGLIREMFDRYRRMEEVGVRNIEAYNNKMPDKMPFLCVVVDELADLMMTAAFDVEQSLCRLAQLGRATGIHLIIATQRPSVDVVTGLIKANFPSRISFGVTSQVDSRTILDTAGADKLLGRGDMLYLPIDASKPARVQNVFIGDGEIADLVNFWKSTPWPRLRQIDLLSGLDGEDADGSAGGAAQAAAPGRDEMMEKAIELAMSQRKLSTSLLQRRLRIGYPRAARLMDQLEEEGIVGPGEGSKSRDVIIGQG